MVGPIRRYDECSKTRATCAVLLALAALWSKTLVVEPLGESTERASLHLQPTHPNHHGLFALVWNELTAARRVAKAPQIAAGCPLNDDALPQGGVECLRTTKDVAGGLWRARQPHHRRSNSKFGTRRNGVVFRTTLRSLRVTLPSKLKGYVVEEPPDARI